MKRINKVEYSSTNVDEINAVLEKYNKEGFELIQVVDKPLGDRNPGGLLLFFEGTPAKSGKIAPAFT